MNLVEEKNKISKMSNADLMSYEKEISDNVAKYYNFQHAMKILINSNFGAAGNPYFRYYELRNAEAITTTGQVIIKSVSEKINNYINKIAGTDVDNGVVGDTDSGFFCLQPIVEKYKKNLDTKQKIVEFLDRFSEEKIQNVIKDCFDNLAEYTNCSENIMIMKREKICERLLVKAKKKYAFLIWDKEGTRYSEPIIDFTGLETNKSDTPEFCRKALSKCLETLMTKEKDDVQHFVQGFKKTFFSQPVETVAFPKGVKNIEKYQNNTTIYTKGTPIYVRAALLYNHYVKKHELLEKYPLLNSGDKLKYVYLKTPNPIGEDVIGFPTDLPKEFGLHSFVDYAKQYEKTFYNPMKELLQAGKIIKNNINEKNLSKYEED